MKDWYDELPEHIRKQGEVDPYAELYAKAIKEEIDKHVTEEFKKRIGETSYSKEYKAEWLGDKFPRDMKLPENDEDIVG